MTTRQIDTESYAVSVWTSGVRRVVAIMFIAALVLASCTTTPIRPQATDLSKAGRATFDVTIAYYTALRDVVRAEFEEETMIDALADLQSECINAKLSPDSNDCAGKLDAAETVKRLRQLVSNQTPTMLKFETALSARVRLADAVGKLYDQYGALADQDLTAEFGARADGLTQAINGVRSNPLPGAAQDLVGQMLGDIGTAIQNHTLKEGAAVLSRVSASYARLYTAEQPAWKTMPDQYLDLATKNAVVLLQAGYADVSAASNPKIQAYGLEPSSRSLADNPATREVLLQSAVRNATQFSTATLAAGEATGQALERLASAQASFPAPPGDAEAVLGFVARAEAYLAIVQKWKDERAGK